jgi:hypothetical protein
VNGSFSKGCACFYLLPPLSATTDKMRRGAPGVIRECLKAPYRIYASDCVVCGQPSTRHRAERRNAMGFAQFAKCFRAMFQSGKALPGRRSGC